MSVGRASAERIANPMEGRIAHRASPAPPTRLMLLSRYAYAFLAPAGLLVWSLLPAGEVVGRTLLIVAWLIVAAPLSAGANGSWTWMAPFGGWQIGMLIEGFALMGALAWGMLADDPLVMPFATTLLMGAVLGMGAMQLWQSLQRRR